MAVPRAHKPMEVDDAFPTEQQIDTPIAQFAPISKQLQQTAPDERSHGTKPIWSASAQYIDPEVFHEVRVARPKIQSTDSSHQGGQRFPCLYALCTELFQDMVSCKQHVESKHQWYIYRPQGFNTYTPRRLPPGGLDYLDFEKNEQSPQLNQMVAVPVWIPAWHTNWLRLFHKTFRGYPPSDYPRDFTTAWCFELFDIVRAFKKDVAQRKIPEPNYDTYRSPPKLSSTTFEIHFYKNAFYAARCAQEQVNMQFAWLSSLIANVPAQLSNEAARFVIRVAVEEIMYGDWNGTPDGIAQLVVLRAQERGYFNGGEKMITMKDLARTCRPFRATK